MTSDDYFHRRRRDWDREDHRREWNKERMEYELRQQRRQLDAQMQAPHHSDAECTDVNIAQVPPENVGRGNAQCKSPGRVVVINDVRLRNEDVNFLEQTYQTRINDGNYWYDHMTGAWGLKGGPTAGFIMPGLNLGGPMCHDASNGNTGVFINGRHLHVHDVLALQQIVAVVLPGRYWMDAQGNFGWEGGPWLGNLWALAASTGAPREGILSTYDKTGLVVIGD